MERIFREEGLPVELTRLPLIESCFNVQRLLEGRRRRHLAVHAADRPAVHARRHAGRRAARSDRLDARRRALPAPDVRHARHAGRSPITAYNHGPAGIARAVDEIGTSDIGRIVREYRGNAFGFASRNFYAEFLAALDVERDHDAALR